MIPTHNRAKSLSTLLQCLGYQRDLEDLNWEIVIVDNASTDNTKEIAYAFSEGSNLNINYVYEPKMGSSYARNAGVVSSKADLILFIDDDLLLPKDYLSNFFIAMYEFKDFDIFMPRILPDWEYVEKQPFWLTFNKPFNIMQSFLPFHDLGIEPLRYPNRFAKNPISGSFLVKKQVFEKIGLFRDDLGVNQSGQCEDTEFFLLAMICKIKILYWPYATVYHPVNPKRLNLSSLHHYYFKIGKSMYLIKNTGRIFNIKKKQMIGVEGYIANKYPAVLKSILLDVKILKLPIFLILKLLLLILLLPLSVFLLLIKCPFYISTKIATTIGEANGYIKS